MNIQNIIPSIQILTPILAITISTISLVVTSRIGAKAARLTKDIAEERERPYVAIYYHSIPNNDFKTLIIKNFGRTGAHIQDITFNPILNDYMGNPLFAKLKGTFLAPSQSISYSFQSDYIKDIQPKEYQVVANYYNGKHKDFTESFNINFGSEVELRSTYRTSDDVNKDISYTLQDMYNKMI
ncbi:MAG: hypothetical protein PHQ32_06335 [Firmicutes bacterium]|nr:hypothetical protein [Bacillota bacterium]